MISVKGPDSLPERLDRDRCHTSVVALRPYLWVIETPMTGYNERMTGYNERLRYRFVWSAHFFPPFLKFGSTGRDLAAFDACCSIVSAR
jgi:hypothetical protein